MKLKVFSLSRYVEQALKLAEYSRDEDGVVIAHVPAASGFFAQAESFEEAPEHQRMVHPESGVIIPIPVHKGKDVSVGLVRQIIREAGVNREQWIGL